MMFMPRVQVQVVMMQSVAHTVFSFLQKKELFEPCVATSLSSDEAYYQSKKRLQHISNALTLLLPFSSHLSTKPILHSHQEDFAQQLDVDDILLRSRALKEEREKLIARIAHLHVCISQYAMFSFFTEPLEDFSRQNRCVIDCVLIPRNKASQASLVFRDIPLLHVFSKNYKEYKACVLLYDRSAQESVRSIASFGADFVETEGIHIFEEYVSELQKQYDEAEKRLEHVEESLRLLSRHVSQLYIAYDTTLWRSDREKVFSHALATEYTLLVTGYIRSADYMYIQKSIEKISGNLATLVIVKKEEGITKLFSSLFLLCKQWFSSFKPLRQRRVYTKVCS